jgi:hypothetical protein
VSNTLAKEFPQLADASVAMGVVDAVKEAFGVDEADNAEEEGPGSPKGELSSHPFERRVALEARPVPNRDLRELPSRA